VPDELIDTHAHLDDDRFRDDLPAVLERATAAGVSAVVAIATTAPSNSACIALAHRFSSVYATVGIQPNEIARAESGAWDDVVRLADSARVVGVGETGLDRHWDDTPFAQQEDYFARHLFLARRLELPVVIHCREAEADVVRMLREEFDLHGPVRGVMHSFTGDLATAEACLAVGLFISFAGMLTFKNAGALRDVAARIPHDRLLVETDAPYLAPVPARGKRNEPAFVASTCAVLAGIHRATPRQMAHYTTQNARKLFSF
jgi:TatD DNase family protein